MAQAMRVAVLLLSLVAGAWSQECLDGSCTSAAEHQGSMLMQHAQQSGSLQAKHKQKARVNHAGTVSLLMAEMTEMIETKGQSGMGPGDIEHIHSIKALIDDTILPTVMEEVEANQEELDKLYAAIVACGVHANESAHITREDSLETQVTEITKKTRDCEVKEDILMKRTKEACTTLNHTRLSIYLPSDEAFPAPTVPDEELIKYLDFMDDFYCGTYEIFYHEWEMCDEYEENYTITHQECKFLQKEMETMSCKAKSHVEKSCEVFDMCWTQAVKNYNQRVKEILDIQKARIDEFEGASNIQCLWSAWIYEYMPCTVNKTRVKECHEYKPNVSNVTVGFLPPPNPPPCSGTLETMGPVDICSEDWMTINFGDLGISQTIIEDLRKDCIPCEPYKWTSAPVVTKHVHSYNAKHILGNNYMKMSTGTACDSFVETDDPNVWAIKFSPMDRMAKYIVEIVFNGTSIGMELEAGTGKVLVDDNVIVYHELDVITMQVKQFGGIAKLDFMENGEMFDSYRLPDGEVSGFGKMTMCGLSGTEGKVEFLLTE